LILWRNSTLAGFLMEHDLFGKPVSTFPDHAPGHRPVKFP
jgi:hypothetical protein